MCMYCVVFTREMTVYVCIVLCLRMRRLCVYVLCCVYA